MKQFIKIMCAGLLTLAATAQAQQDASPQPTKKKEKQEARTPAPRAEPDTNPQGRRPAAGAHAAPRAYPPGGVTPRVRRPITPSSTPQGPRRPNVPAANREDRGDASAQGEQPDTRKSRTRHAGFHAQPKPQQVPSVGFDENRRIKNSEHWPGDKYAAFRCYRPHRHDRDWYHRHFRHIVFICGGYYYWNNFYWYPAWGYDPFYSYYVYDGPVYSSTVLDSPDQVIADVQAALQDLGYYDGEVDGILGELTREAIIAYQADYGLYQTAAIDQPTLESLGLG